MRPLVLESPQELPGARPLHPLFSLLDARIRDQVGLFGQVVLKMCARSEATVITGTCVPHV